MSKPAREIELKFLLDASAAEAVLAALPEDDAAVRDMVAVYYDTADQSLSQAGFGLRVRKTDGTRIQTLKSAIGSDGGRDEWEWPISSDTPDRSLLLDTPAPVTADTVLEPQFTVRSRRAIRTLREGDSEIELVIDDAEVSAGERKDSFLELELELKSGDPATLFDLARRLSRIAPLRLSSVSKAERGYALAANGARRRPRYETPRLSDDLSAGQALQAVGGACLAHLCANAESLRTMPGPEGVHQLRVAVRRLRAALSTFKALIPEAERTAVKDRLKWLAGALDEARNLDVFIADVWRPAARDHHDLPGMADFGRALLAAQTRAYVDVAAALDSTHFRTVVLETAAWLQCGAWTRDPGAAPERDGPAAAFAAAALGGRRKKVLKAGRRLAKLDRETRHRLRIKTKVLRYAAEDLADLFSKHPKRADRFIGALKALQDGLGALNDLAFSEDLARDVALGASSPEAAFAVGRLTARRADDEAALLKSVGKALTAFRKADPFW